MLTRRLVLAAATLLVAAGTAQAQAWKQQYPELGFALIPEENASGITNRWTPFT